MKRIWHEARPVLIFNRKKLLVLIASSVNEAARISNLRPGNISKVCNNQLMSLGNYYFRYIDKSVEVELSDIGSLQLEEYDKLCGIERPVYATMKMNRKNWKYKTKSKDEN